MGVLCRGRFNGTGSCALQAQRVKEVGLGLCSALFHMNNSCQVVHQDIKPANIIIMSDGVPKVRRWILQKSGHDCRNGINACANQS